MKKLYFLLVTVCVFLIGQPNFIFAQSDTSEVSIDLLRAPSSPAGNIIGITNSQIERPSDPAAFMTSIQTATQNFASFPTAYAVDLAPAWLFSSQNIDLYELDSNNIGNVFKQSFVLSFATNTLQPDSELDSTVTQFSTGIKFSLIRGNFSQEFKDGLATFQNKLAALAAEKLRIVEQMRATNPGYKALEDELAANLDDEAASNKILHKLDSLDGVFFIAAEENTKNMAEQVADYMKKVQLNRYGFKLDFSAAFAWDFPDQQYNKGRLSKGGAWVTTGWDWKKGISLLGIGRYLVNPDHLIYTPENFMERQDLQTLDGGLRLIANIRKFSFSGEAIYRSFVNDSDVDPAWRYTINAEYDIGLNKKLSFIFGRDFDGVVSKDGTVIAVVNLLMGFGSNAAVKH